MSRTPRVVLAGATWCVLAGVVGCARAAPEPLETRGQRSDEPAMMSTAGQPSDPEVVDATQEWCAVRAMLEAKCQRCHGETLDNGAPFSLVSYADTQQTNRKGTPRFEAIADAIRSDLMPPTFIELEPPVELLSEAERALLLEWCDGGAPGDDEATCD